jgi:hypothetical protein
VLTAGKSASGFLSLLGGVVAGIQVLIAAGAISCTDVRPFHAGRPAVAGL